MSSTTPRQTDPQSVIEDLRVLMAKNIQGNMRLVNRFGGLIKEATDQIGDVSEGGLPKGNELLGRLLDLNLAFVTLLSDYGISFLGDLMSAAEQNLAVRPKTKESRYTAQEVRVRSAEPVSGIELNIKARIGETAVAPFVIENQQTATTGVTFQASNLVSGTGHSVSSDCISFEPAALSLHPNQQAVVKAKVQPDNRFRVGESYASSITVLGFDTSQISLVVTILPALQQAKETRKTGAKKKRRARKPKGQTGGGA